MQFIERLEDRSRVTAATAESGTMRNIFLKQNPGVSALAGGVFKSLDSPPNKIPGTRRKIRIIALQ